MCHCNPRDIPSIFSNIIDEKSQKNLCDSLVSHITKKQQKIAKQFFMDMLEGYASQIFINGTVYTMDQKNPIVEAIAIRLNKIIKVGKLQDVLKLKGTRTNVIDLQKRVILPGFIDPHIHMAFTMIQSWMDLGPFVNSNMQQIAQKIKKAVSEHKNPNKLITGQLFDPQITKGRFDYTIQGLDNISDKFGIFILQANAHVAHVNTFAFKLAGIDKTTKDPPLGRYIKDRNGQLTGQIQETAIMIFKKYFQMVDQQTYTNHFKEFLQECASKGCTTLHDCGIGLVHPKVDLSILYKTFNQDMPVRYSGFLVSTSWDVWKQSKIVPDNKDLQLRINGIKCWADGSTQAGSAYLKDNYKVQKWGKGYSNYKFQELYHSVKVAHDDGWQVGVHANGDAAIDMVLDVYEKVQKQNLKDDMRHRIEHCTICDKQQLQRMKKLNISPSFLIGHIYYYGHVFNNILGKQRGFLNSRQHSIQGQNQQFIQITILSQSILSVAYITL